MKNELKDLSNNPEFVRKLNAYFQSNCRIGSHSTILPGVTIGKNSIVGAHSLVTKDIPDNVVAFGVPAKAIRKLNNND